MYQTHDVVVLRRDLPDYGLLEGAVGTIVGVYEVGGYEVELTAAAGDTVTVVTLDDDDVRPISHREGFSERAASKRAESESRTPSSDESRRRTSIPSRRKDP